MENKAYLVIFETNIAGENARTEVSTDKNPFFSRAVRRSCEDVASVSFHQLAAAIGRTWDGRLKCVECLEIRGPEADQ